jgi:hypothetical protein
MTPPAPATWIRATTAPALAPPREDDMTVPAIRALSMWWTGRQPADFVAREIVGQLGIADLVAVRFDHCALRDRRAAGIRACDDLLVLKVLLACRRGGRTVRDLVDLLGYSESGIRRAVRDGRECGALVDVGQRRHRTHEAWRPASKRLVAVELKRTDWQRAAHQASAYQAWANASWLVLGQRPPLTAMQSLMGSGIGLGYLGDDGQLHRALRPDSRRHATSEGAVWAAEQALVHALAVGADPLAPVRPERATSRAARVATAC